MASKRSRVLAEQIRQILSTAILFEMRDAAFSGLVITGVRVSDDLGYADIEFTYPENEHTRGEVMGALSRAGGAFKRSITSQVRLRKIPELRFHVDESVRAEQRIQNILDGLDIPPEAEGDDNKS